jgi:molybdopterin molybdotransferase
MMVTVKEALSLIRESITPLGIEDISLDRLQGRVLAGDITASFSLPRFTNAAMDGFALKWEDIRHASAESPVLLHVTQVIPAGSHATMPVVSGCCAEIMTGAPLPEGADTVLAFEDTSGFGSAFVEIYRVPESGANIRFAGEEVAVGEKLLGKGSVFTPSEIAVLASFGSSSASVKRTPRVSIVTVGDELRLPGEKVTGAQIYNCNRFLLAAACRSVGIEPVGIHHAPDDRESLREVLEHSLAECDLLITAGGISTGEYDFVQEELSRLGVLKKFWGVAQKPGKPLYFGCSGTGAPVFSLPGNPVSALFCFVEYCIPALNTLQGKKTAEKVQAVLAEPFPADRKRHRFLCGNVWVEEGRLLCRISPKVESHMITSLPGSNCLIEAGPSGEPLPAGSRVAVTMLPWAGL